MNRIKRPQKMTPRQALLKTMAGILATWLVIGVLMFIGAGRLDWVLGWLFLFFWGFLKILFILLLYWHDPDLLVERATRHQNTQPYERVILPIYFVFSFITILLAAIDGGRFRWSGEVPLAVIVIAYILFLLGNGLASWAVAANPFFSSESRIQRERKQKVTYQGPYQFIRHPGYLAAILMWPVTGLVLASWWASIPGLLAALMMLIRTILEDKMLQVELAGYDEYVQQVRYRLFPGIF